MPYDEIDRDYKLTNDLRSKGSKHYVEMKVQPWDVVDSWSLEQQLGFYRGNLLKYCMRLGNKDNELQEASKALHYAQKLVSILEKKKD